VGDGLDRLSSTRQELLTTLHRRKPAETNWPLVHFFADIVNGIRVSPQFMMSDAFAKYRFAEDVMFAFEFPILGFLLDMADALCGSFCERIWARPGSGQSPFGKCVAVTAILYGEPET
jgi:hypothetical protein